MGKPEQLDEETPESESSAGTRREERPRRLFRDPDDRVLGGVASGLAAYFNWDPMWVRIALILLAIPVHGLILVYLIAWIVIPVAHTATEKLQMHGRTISMENIGRTVTDSFERVNDYVRSDKPRSILHRIGSGIVQMVRPFDETGIDPDCHLSRSGSVCRNCNRICLDYGCYRYSDQCSGLCL